MNQTTRTILNSAYTSDHPVRAALLAVSRPARGAKQLRAWVKLANALDELAAVVLVYGADALCDVRVAIAELDVQIAAADFLIALRRARGYRGA